VVLRFTFSDELLRLESAAVQNRRAILKLLALGLVPVTAAKRAVAKGLHGPGNTGPAPLWPHHPRVEWRAAPTGVDSKRPRFSWLLTAADSASRNVAQQAFRIVVATSESRARAGHGDVWDSGKRPSAALSAIPDRDLELAQQSRFYWSLSVWDRHGRTGGWSVPEAFTTGMAAHGWQARWIAASTDRPLAAGPPPAINTDPPVEPHPLPLFRHDFHIGKPIRRAIVCVSGLGQYELRLNGQQAGTGVLNPGWTDYRKTVLYDTADVTTLLRKGSNTIGVLLGNGMYNVEKYAGRYTKFVGTFGQPKLILQLKLSFMDDSEQTVSSDGSWQVRPGPIVFSSTYGGEDFDARLEPEGWDRPDRAESPRAAAEGWGPALEVAGPGGVLRAQNVPPIVVANVLKPVAVSQPKAGVFVYDLGENFSGWPKITVRGPAGSRVKLLPGELLDQAGLVTQRSANARPGNEVSFSYTLKGSGDETWRPRFSYYGFRYVQVEGAEPVAGATAGQPVLLSLEGEFLHADLPRTGIFQSSDARLMGIHKIILQALLSNTVSVLTDCPHREKLGWLEQTHLNADTVFYNEDAVTLYEKMSRDMADSQLASGMIPEISPEYLAFLGSDSLFRDSPEWGAAVVLSPWVTYRYTGDSRILESGYPAMKRYAQYLSSRLQDGLLDFGLGDWYDIGPRPPGPSQLTSRPLTATATFCQILLALTRIARILGHDDDAALYRRDADTIKAGFNSRLFQPLTNQYDSGSMTANAMPLAIGLVPEERRAAVLNNLIADIRAHDNHVTAGDVGFHYVVLALMENGRGDVLYDILSRTDSPSYGYQLARGATALSEAWDANPTKSQNHFMLGHAETWLYGGLAGIRIDLDREGASRIQIAPQPAGEIESASARYHSVFGEIVSAWHRQNDRLQLEVQVPAGSQAQVVLQAASADDIRESGAPLPKAHGVLAARSQAGQVTITIGSGRYHFDAPAPSTSRAG
jgi:alpha-L-rhamnosidase